MRNILKLVIATFLAITCVSMLGCGCKANTNVANSKYVGQWEATSASLVGEDHDVEEVLDGPCTMELNGDGTASADMGGEKINATWSETNNGIMTKGSSDKFDLVFTDNDGALDTSIIGMNFHLVKM